MSGIMGKGVKEMIKAQGVSKSYHDVLALSGVNLDVRRGSIYGLIGSNGAGKTTLLKILAGIYRQDKGRLEIDAQDVFENEGLKQRVIFIPDTPYFLPQHTIDGMAEFYRGIYENFSDERYEKLKEVFQMDTSKKIESLSKGMQRQVAFWLALSMMPDLLVLDEPLDGLDPVVRQRVKNLLIQDVAQRDMSVVISSHNLRELEDICDSIGILHRGEMVAQKDIDDFKSDVHKIQVAFRDMPESRLYEGMDVLYREERGSVSMLIVRGRKAEVISRFRELQPVILDILPLTLEEIFIYEMGDIGYAIKDVFI